MKVTLDEVIKKFDAKIERTILNKKFAFAEVQDVKQDIYLNMVRRKYLQKYDPKYKLSTYIYTFVNNECRHIWRDSFAKKRAGRYHMISLDNDTYSFLKETLPSGSKNPQKSIELNDFVLGVMKEVSKNKVYVIKGRKGNVDFKKVIDLIISGYNVREVAKKLKISWPIAYKRLKRLSTRAWVKEYAKN
jgi:hypothetical protein